MTIRDRLKRLERLAPLAYVPEPFVPIRLPKQTYVDAIKGAIVAGLIEMMSDSEIEELVEKRVKEFAFP